MNTTVASPHTGTGSRVQRVDYRAGLLAGLVAGLAMTIPMMAMTTFMMDMGPWAAPKMAWSLVAGKEVIVPGFELVPVMGGVVVHLGLSAVFGLAFAAVASVMGVSGPLWGLLFGFGLYLTNILAIPRLLPGWAGHMFPPNPMMHAASIGEHVFFGLVWAWAYRAWRRP
jgi:hypothetical protein